MVNTESTARRMGEVIAESLKNSAISAIAVDWSEVSSQFAYYPHIDEQSLGTIVADGPIVLVRPMTLEIVDDGSDRCEVQWAIGFDVHFMLKLPQFQKDSDGVVIEYGEVQSLESCIAITEQICQHLTGDNDSLGATFRSLQNTLYDGDLLCQHSVYHSVSRVEFEFAAARGL